MFVVLLLENLENTNLRELRYEIMYILLCYSALSKTQSIKREFDKCFILSADNDFATAITRARELNPDIKVIIQPPPLSRKKPAQKRDYAIDNLEHCSGNKALLTNFYTIKKHQFSDKCGVKNPWIIIE